MSVIDFMVRTPAGVLQSGTIGGSDQGLMVDASGGRHVSLNITQSAVRGYDRVEDDLLITLVDGRVILLDGFFDDGVAVGKVFLSADGMLNEVVFVESDGGALFAQYGPTEVWGKWSPNDRLMFLDSPSGIAEAAVAAPGSGAGAEVGMLGAGILGVGGFGVAGLSGLGFGAAALVDRDGGGDNSGPPWVPPTVDDPEASYTISGGDNPIITVTGTANPGSVVEVTIGDVTLSTEAGDDRAWEVVFEGANFPPDGQ